MSGPVGSPTEIVVALPPWASQFAREHRSYDSPEARMGLAVEVARRNVATDSGGPFGAAVFESASGRLVSVGMNMVVASNNSFLHAEIVALMCAQQAVGSYTLRAPAHELYTSCAPCAMCLGAVLWSGVTTLVSGAAREDAMEIGFEEGPVFDASYEYLVARGINCQAGVLREEARAVLQVYRARNAVIYNG
jgi:tRNA(Arg) A34 adenosine deaminase TadA